MSIVTRIQRFKNDILMKFLSVLKVL